MPTRLQIATSDIFQVFEDGPRILGRREIEAILSENRSFWRLAQATTTDEFIAFLKKKGKLREFRFDLPYRPSSRFTWGDVPTLEIVQSLRPEGYFSHFTAMHLHGLTEQIPKTVYLNAEQRLSGGGGSLSQESIDRAFRANCRISSNCAPFDDQSICIINGQNTGQLGVIKFQDESGSLLRATNIERTLIDVTVRPVYSGGVFQVAAAFSAAHDRRVSINRLVAYLRKLNFTYPYYQAIGFYLERSGVYSAQQIGLLRQFAMDYDFYLTHAMKKTDYVPEWRLFVPKGF